MQRIEASRFSTVLRDCSSHWPIDLFHRPLSPSRMPVAVHRFLSGGLTNSRNLHQPLISDKSSIHLLHCTLTTPASYRIVSYRIVSHYRACAFYHLHAIVSCKMVSC
ncbi:hypothetical protein BDZ91DRAFT_516168 [Kalaharituber pfeilii]|nr:hypothetical protein BDZ91DRAFT_516168 [Kalaharituber pfeilii]